MAGQDLSWITPDHVIQARRELSQRSLANFVKLAWHVIEPGQPYVHGPHIDAMCEMLEAVERGEIKRLLINVPPGTSKPVHVDEPVMTRRGYVRLGDVAVGDEVLTHKGRFRRVTATHDQGELDLVQVVTNAGREVLCAPDHPFLTTRGWVDAGDMVPGDYVGFPHRNEPMGDDSMSPEEARLLGYLVGDGSLSTGYASFTQLDQEAIDDFIRCAQSLGFYARAVVHPNKGVKAKKVVLKSTATKWGKGEPPIAAWLKRHGLWKSNSYTKRIPSAVFASGEDAIRNFIGAYWTCDGHISSRHVNKRTAMVAKATAVSVGLAHDVLRALTAINIDARIRTKRAKLNSAKQPGGLYTSYDIQTSERNEVTKFVDMPGLISRKANAAKIGFRDRFDPAIYSDEVISVTNAGRGHCVCLTVDEDESFTVNGLIVHNSTICGVFFPMWMWGPKKRPSSRFVGVAHEQTLGIRDNLKCRRLAASDWYQRLWGDTVQLTKDQNAKINFENTQTGFRQVATPSNITGRRGDIVLLDDPLSAENANSEAEREKVNLWFRESLPTRLNNPDSSAIVVVMQRLHERDVSGLILSEDLGYEHLMLPMRYESERSCTRDWRTEPGELLFPARFSEDTVAELEKTLGPYATAGQLQQRPAPRDGGLFKSSWFEVIDAMPAGNPSRVRAWDLAATKKAGTNNPDWTAGLRMARYPDGTFVIENVRRLRGSPLEVEQAVMQTAQLDGTGVIVRMTQDPGQAGKAQAEQFVRKLAGFPVVTKPATGDKATRATPAAAQAEVGNIKILRTGDRDQDAWIQPFLDEIALFPAGAHDDQVDTLADAVNELALANRYNIAAW